MALISMRQLLDHAAENGYGLPAFNVNNMEQIQGIMEAAAETDSPVILQGSAGARKYAGEPFLRKLVEAAVEQWPDIPIAMHQDHGSSPAVCQKSIRSGFTSVMMDGSLLADAKTPSSYEYNIEVTRRVVDMAHAVGVSVEGELGVLGSLETGEAGEEDGVGAEGKLTREQLLTDPDQAVDFVAQTGCDALAIAIGTSHGAYKFTKRAHRRGPRDRPHRRDPSSSAGHAPGHARLLERAAGVARGHSRVRRRDEGDLRRAVRRDPRGHPKRRAQGQHRHRHPPRHDRRHAAHHGRGPERLRPACRSSRPPGRPPASCAPGATRRSARQGGRASIKPVSLEVMAEKYGY